MITPQLTDRIDRAAVLRRVMCCGRRDPNRTIPTHLSGSVQPFHFIAAAEPHQQVRNAAEAAGFDVAPWLRHMTRQITKADFPQSWEAGKVDRRNARDQRPPDFHYCRKRFMLRLNDQAGEGLEELTAYFDALNAEVIRQRIAQAGSEAFPQRWQMAAAEPRHPSTTELREAMHTAPRTTVSGGVDAPHLL